MNAPEAVEPLSSSWRIPLRVTLQLNGGGERPFDLKEGDTLWLGRHAECVLVLDGSEVSRRHLSIACQHGQLLLADASHNGTRVDGALLRKASRVVAGPKSQLQIGQHTIELKRCEAVQAGALAAGVPEVEPVRASAGVEAPPLLRRRVHRLLLEYLELPKVQRGQMDTERMRPKVLASLGRILEELHAELPRELDRDRLVAELCDEALGLGPLESLLSDVDVSEIMVVDASSIYAERRGRLELTGLTFTDDESVRAAIERIVTPLGRRIDESTPLVDARLKDGSRVNAVIPPLAIKGPSITIRKFSKDPLLMEDLIRFDSLTPQMARFLDRAVRVRKNVIISGGTGSGKTTLLNVLSASIPEHERLVTIEDAAELQLRQAHVVSLESRPPNLEGKGEYTIRDLLKNALRMRPDRIIVGECRGGETLDMLQAMNTGHEGSMTTTHANSPREAVARIETLCLMAGVDLPVRAIRRQIASSVHVIVQQSRFSDGSRRIVSIAEVAGLDDDGEIELHEIFNFRRSGTGGDNEIQGEYLATGYLPSFVDQFISSGLVQGNDYL